MQHFNAACGTELPEDYIYASCRLAVAHANVKGPSDADDAEEINRLHSASHALRLLARRLIVEEFGISDRTYSGD
jgi:hypothetical protein